MSKHPLGGRTDVSEDSDVHSERVLDAARRSACGNGFSVTESAERARPWIRQLFQHRTVSTDLTKVKTPVWWAHRRVKSLGRSLGGECSTRLAGALVVTAVRLRSRLSVPDRGSGGCHSTVCHPVSYPVSKITYALRPRPKHPTMHPKTRNCRRAALTET